MMVSDMRCLICDCSPLEDDALYSRAYAVLSDARRRRADFYRFRDDKMRSITAGLFVGLIERSFGRVTEDTYGKLHSEGIEFSISHSGRYVAFAFSKTPAGVDIEKVGRNMDIARRVMTAEEFEEFDSAVKEDDRDDVFCRMWTAKESYMKYRGLGFRLPPETFRVLYGHDIRSPDISVTLTELDPPDGYHLTACSADDTCTLGTITVEELLEAESIDSFK